MSGHALDDFSISTDWIYVNDGPVLRLCFHAHILLLERSECLHLGVYVKHEEYMTVQATMCDDHKLCSSGLP